MGKKSQEVEKCGDCISHTQYLTVETFDIVSRYILDWRKKNPGKNKPTKSRAVNDIIKQWKKEIKNEAVLRSN